MEIDTPATITNVAWEGEMVPPEPTVLSPFEHFTTSANEHMPVITIGQPELWHISEVLSDEDKKAWHPPRDDAEYWLLRLACTLHKPRGLERIAEARKVLTLTPKSFDANPRAVYAHSLFPDRMETDETHQVKVALGPELEFARLAEVKLAKLETSISYRKVFPVIQSYGIGEPEPYWIFKRHASYPLEGSQFVYAIVAVGKQVGDVRAQVHLSVTVELAGGLARVGLSREAEEKAAFVF
jgi:hypothetical protein